MGCATTGIVAILVFGAALIFSALSLLAPNWSMTESPMDPLTDIKFSTGVWGYCVNAKFNTGANLSSTMVDTCYGFYFGGKIPLNSSSNLREVNGTHRTVCDALDSDSDLAQFMDVTGVDATAFRSFLVLSCGSVGRSSFAFALLSTFFGVIAFLTSILFVICFPVKSCLMSFLKAITFGAALSSLIAFSCWLAQTKPLAKVGMHPGSCFVIEILACACFLGAYVAMNHHAASESIEAKSID
ncbi:unnamed protein product [Aphanomyces euteiches]